MILGLAFIPGPGFAADQLSMPATPVWECGIVFGSGLDSVGCRASPLAPGAGQTWIRRFTASVISATASSTGTPFFCSPLR